MKNILDMLYDYSNRTILFDEQAVSRILDILISEYNLDVKHAINKDFGMERGYFLGDTVHILLNHMNSGLLNGKYCINAKVEQNLPPFYKFFRMNLEILHTCMHELEHALQEKYYYEKNKSVEQQLIADEIHFVKNLQELSIYYDAIEKIETGIPRTIELIKAKIFYNLNYNRSIIERFAEIHSTEKILQMLESVRKDLSIIYRLEEYYLYKVMLQSYKNSPEGPSIKFLFNLGYPNRAFYYRGLDLSSDERLYYGFDLSSEELEEKKKILSAKSL